MKSYHSVLIIPILIMLHSCGAVSLKDVGQSSTVRSVTGSSLITTPANLLLGGSFGNKFFYEPKSDLPNTPASYGLSYQDVTFNSSDGAQLHGWLIPAKNGIESSKKTILYHHGNYGSMGYHVSRIPWLIQSGYNVFMYDYRGYGKSSGIPDRRGIINDAKAAFDYVLRSNLLAHTEIISYGHSLGGVKMVAALSELPYSSRVKNAIIESSFASYKDMASHMGGDLANTLTDDSYAPYTVLNRIRQPITIIHGTKDTIIPLSQAQKLVNSKSTNQNCHLIIVNNGTHYDCLRVDSYKVGKQLFPSIN